MYFEYWEEIPMLIRLEDTDKKQVIDILKKYAESFPKSKAYNSVRSDVKNIIKKLNKNIVVDLNIAEHYLMEHAIVLTLKDAKTDNEKEILSSLAMRVSLR